MVWKCLSSWTCLCTCHLHVHTTSHLSQGKCANSEMHPILRPRYSNFLAEEDYMPEETQTVGSSNPGHSWVTTMDKDGCQSLSRLPKALLKHFQAYWWHRKLQKYIRPNAFMLANLSAVELVKKPKAKTWQVSPTTALVTAKWNELFFYLAQGHITEVLLLLLLLLLIWRFICRKKLWHPLFRKAVQAPKFTSWNTPICSRKLGLHIVWISGKWNLSLNMNSIFQKYLLLTMHQQVPHGTESYVKAKEVREKTLCSGSVTPEYSKGDGMGRVFPTATAPLDSQQWFHCHQNRVGMSIVFPAH